MNHCPTKTDCPIEALIHLIGGKYKPLILWHLISGPLRYSALRKRVSHATPKMLTQHLRELEQDGLIIRTVYPTVPVRTEYELSPSGEALVPLLTEMCAWGERYLRGELSKI